MYLIAERNPSPSAVVNICISFDKHINFYYTKIIMILNQTGNSLISSIAKI